MCVGSKVACGCPVLFRGDLLKGTRFAAIAGLCGWLEVGG